MGKHTSVNNGGGQMGVITEESDEGNQRDDIIDPNTHTHTHKHFKTKQRMDAAVSERREKNNVKEM